VTRLRPPDFSVPVLYSCMIFSVFARPFAAGEDRLREEVFRAMITSLARPLRAKNVSSAFDRAVTVSEN
jgi:hypothetical protein